MTFATQWGLHVDDLGVGDAVRLLHSSGLSGRQWRRIVPDLTGHGQSPPWPAPTPFSFRTDVARSTL
jgi:pimeloyl-ACP methyl ester carboxylesterase